ncbi:ganglioside GM2 activator-like [Liolophura sinensis]|uniref:ganglioside GM2 activator-like n=1 Tax=Liolophura sinensis TaxID=3198878 RepID=UPI00315838A8
MRAFLFVVVVVYLGTISEGSGLLNVVRFEKKLEKEANKVAHLFNIFSPRKDEGLKPVEILKHWSTSHVNNLGNFAWKNCGKASDPIKLMNFSVSPDPVVLPGTLSIGFAVVSNKTVVSPLSADVVIQKKVGSSYITVPCVGTFGSCHYQDFCQLLAPIPQCPPEFMQKGIPCKCPFKQGNYTLPNITFDLDAVPLPSGEYHGKIDLSYDGTHMGCFEIYASIEAGFV